MQERYESCKKVWDDIFAKEAARVPGDKTLENRGLNSGIDWLCAGTDFVLDFGCGNGIMLFYCALRGTKKHLGIDISPEAINLANRSKAKMPKGEFDFCQGDVSFLESLEDSLVDGIVLSNIIDNLYPEDAAKLLAQVNRILRPGGKVLVKLNPYLEQKQIEAWKIKVIEGNLLDDGLLLWNQTTDEWTKMFGEYFLVQDYKEIFYEEHEQYNRLFLLINKLGHEPLS